MENSNRAGISQFTHAGVRLGEADPPIALGPLDGRYRAVITPLIDYLSEPALNRMRIYIEVEWLIYLCENSVVPGAPRLNADEQKYLRSIPITFGPRQIEELGEIERETVHDVKAVEYFIKRRIQSAPDEFGPDSQLNKASELVHFSCTSEDINNLSYALMIQGAITDVWLPAARSVIDLLTDLAHNHAGTPMLSHTHGQPATPTTLGKEMAVFAHRLGRQIKRVSATQFLGKMNGAVGTYGAHREALPEVDWPAVTRDFITQLGLTWNPLTTQIESHDWQSELFNDVARFNRIAHNLATDMWTYISNGYFIQARDQGTVGSSTMPHKVNPIRFENAEANFEISCALLDTLSATLVTSRMQRDLTDSTTQRNIGPAIGHSVLALDNLRRGLGGVDVNVDAMDADLENNWEVLAEPIQTVMRALAIAGVPGMDEPYERLKALTRGRRIGADEIRTFIVDLELPSEVEQRLLQLTPQTYTGVAESLVEYLD